MSNSLKKIWKIVTSMPRVCFSTSSKKVSPSGTCSTLIAFCTATKMKVRNKWRKKAIKSGVCKTTMAKHRQKKVYAKVQLSYVQGIGRPTPSTPSSGDDSQAVGG